MKTHVVVIGYLILSDHICFINYYTSYKLENTKKKRFYRIYIYIYINKITIKLLALINGALENKDQLVMEKVLTKLL